MYISLDLGETGSKWSCHVAFIMLVTNQFTASDYPFGIFKPFSNEISFTSSLYHKIVLGVGLCFPLSVRICFSPERK